MGTERFQGIDEHGTPHQRFHIDVWVAPEVPDQQIASAVAAGGTIVDASQAPSYTVIADHDGQQGRVRRQLTQPEQSEVNAGAEAIEILLALLDQPQKLYRQASKRARKILNQTFLTCLYIDAPSDTTEIVADQHTDTVAQLRARATQLLKPRPSRTGV